MTSPADLISHKEKREVLLNDRLATTYHLVAQAALNDERGGRYAAGSGSKASVVGSSPVSYPAQPIGSPWHSDPCPPEPPLGYSVDEMEPVGEMFERASTSAASEVEEPPSPSGHSGGDVGRPPGFRRRA